MCSVALVGQLHRKPAVTPHYMLEGRSNTRGLGKALGVSTAKCVNNLRALSFIICEMLIRYRNKMSNHNFILFNKFISASLSPFKFTCDFLGYTLEEWFILVKKKILGTS